MALGRFPVATRFNCGYPPATHDTTARPWSGLKCHCLLRCLPRHPSIHPISASSMTTDDQNATERWDRDEDEFDVRNLSFFYLPCETYRSQPHASTGAKTSRRRFYWSGKRQVKVAIATSERIRTLRVSASGKVSAFTVCHLSEDAKLTMNDER